MLLQPKVKLEEINNTVVLAELLDGVRCETEPHDYEKKLFKNVLTG